MDSKQENPATLTTRTRTTNIKRVMSKRAFWFSVFFVCNALIIVLLGNLSVASFGRGLSARPMDWDQAYPYVSLRIENLDTQSCSATFYILTYIPVSAVSNATWEHLEVEVFSFLPEYQQHQNLSLDRSVRYFLGFAHYELQLGSQRHLYPFDSYSVEIFLRIPAWISTRPRLFGSMSSELSGFFTTTSVDAAFNGISGSWAEELPIPASYPSNYLIFLTIVRPEVYRALILTPFWTIFLVLFLGAKLDPKIKDHFVSKLSLYTGLFIFILGYAFANAPSLSLISDIMKFVLIITMSSFIITDIIQFADKRSKVHVQVARFRLSFEFRDIQFLISLVVLTMLELLLVQGFMLDALRIGLSFALLPIIPLVTLSTFLFLLKRKIWIAVSLVELVLMSSLVVRGFSIPFI